MADRDFFKSVYKIVAEIPCGRVATYGQIAKILGNPRAARSVGWALHRSPESVNIPWHRVINSKGVISIGGTLYNSQIQRSLLENEGIVFDVKGCVDLAVFQWRPEIVFD